MVAGWQIQFSCWSLPPTHISEKSQRLRWESGKYWSAQASHFFHSALRSNISETAVSCLRWGNRSHAEEIEWIRTESVGLFLGEESLYATHFLSSTQPRNTPPLRLQPSLSLHLFLELLSFKHSGHGWARCTLSVLFINLAALVFLTDSRPPTPPRIRREKAGTAGRYHSPLKDTTKCFGGHATRLMLMRQR